MDSAQVFTSLNVPTVITSPSPNCFQWSKDSQAFFTSKSAVYIMTPEYGINFDTNSALKDSVDGDTQEKPVLGWFRTMIQFDKTDACRWTDYSQEWSATSLGSMDITVWAMTISPSHMAPDAGCILAVLSSNMDLTLWIAGKNNLKGEWKKISNVTSTLLQTFLKDESVSRTASTIAAQIICIDWSSQPDFSLSPAPELDGSLLVCGNRAGNLIFLSYDDQVENNIKIEAKITVVDGWILQVAFSQWVLVGPMTCAALVAFSMPDGTVGLVKVTRNLQPSATESPLRFPFTISTTYEQLETKISDARKGALTALKWIDVPGGSPILVYCRPGTVHLWSSPTSSTLTWSGLYTVQLKTQKRSVGSSTLQPVSGIQYIRQRDALLVCLVDGSFHVVYGLAGSGPNLDSSLNSDSSLDTRAAFKLDSKTLSTIARGVFSRVERDGITFADVMRTSGMVCYDDGLGCLMWIHEATRPADFSYKHDAKHNSMFTVARMWDDASDEHILQMTADILTKSKTGSSPLYYLRPVLFHLYQRSTLSRLHIQFVQILSLGNTEVGEVEQDHTLDIHLDAWARTGETGEGQMRENGHTSIDPDVRQDLRKSLKRHLFGYDKLFLLRMKLSLADFAWKLSSSDEQRRADYGSVAQSLLLAISHRNLRTLIRHLTAVAGAFTPGEIPFVLRLVVQSLLPGSPENLSEEGKKLSEILRQIIPVDQHDTHLNELCPACGVEVPLQDIISATCANGHTWSRCSVTTFILSTAQVRTCIGCTRKAFLPFSSLDNRGDHTEGGEHNGGRGRDFLPPAVRNSWFVEELLEAVHRCLFCGNAFVSVL